MTLNEEAGAEQSVLLFVKPDLRAAVESLCVTWFVPKFHVQKSSFCTDGRSPSLNVTPPSEVTEGAQKQSES